MARLVQRKARQLPPEMAVFRDDHAPVDPLAQRIARRGGHLPRRLSDGDDHQPPFLLGQALQLPTHRHVRQRVPKRRRDDPVRVLSKAHEIPSCASTSFLPLYQTSAADSTALRFPTDVHGCKPKRPPLRRPKINR